MRSSTFLRASLASPRLTRIDGRAPGAAADVAAALRRSLAGARPEDGVVFACIGTDRSTGDALGPLVGERLAELGCPGHQVIGTLEDPLHALNLARRMADLADEPSRPAVVAVDAALGLLDDVATITVREGGLRPGLGVGKEIPPIGDASVTATVNVSSGSMDAEVLQSTRLFLVQSLARVIGLGLWQMAHPGDVERLAA